MLSVSSESRSHKRRARTFGLAVVAGALGVLSIPAFETAAAAAASTPTEVVSYSPVAPSPGQSVTFTATVSGTGSAPTGTVTWTIYSSSTAASCAQSTLTASGSSSTATCTFTTASSAAEYFVSATYNGESGTYNSITKGNYAATGGWASSGSSLNECPTVGADTGCGILIILNASGSATIVASGQGPYDGDDDTLVAVLNDTGSSIPSVALSSSTEDIFGFDGDGACSDNTSDAEGEEFGSTWKVGGSSIPYAATGCAYGSSGYEGPNISFSSIATNNESGTVNFTDGGLPNGGAQWFTLENSLSAASFGVPGDFSITKSATPGSVAAGSSTDIDYTMTAHNIGGASANATITDSAPSGTTYVAGSDSCNGASGCTVSVTGSTVTWTLTGAAAGVTDTLTFAVTANASDPSETIENAATWTGSGCTTTPSCSTNTTFTTVTNGAAFTVTKTATSAVTAGSTTPITYTITVENTGTSTSTSVVTVTDAAPSGTTYDTSTPAACSASEDTSTCTPSVSGSTITWTISSGVLVDDSYTLTFEATASASDPTETITNTAAWTGPGCTTSPDCTVSASTVVTNDASFTVTKTSSSSTVAAGEMFTYTITVTNSSASASSTAPVTVTDSAPTGTTYVTGSAACPTGLTPTCTVNGPTEAGLITWSIPAGVTFGESYALTFEVTANSSDPAESITNTATWSGPGCGNSEGCPVSTSTSVTSLTPSNAVTNSPSNPSLNSTVTFTDTVSGPSGGPAPAGTVTWTVTGPSGALSCTNSGSTTLVGEASPNTNVATATCQITASGTGSYSAQTSVTADSYYTASTSNADTFTIFAVSTATNAVTNSPSSVTMGDVVVYTDTLTGPTGDYAPTGTVTWTVTGPGSVLLTCTNSGSTTVTAGSSNSSTATCDVVVADAGGYSASAAYSGDANYNSGSSNNDTFTVGTSTPAVTITPSPTSPTVSEGVTLTATITGPDDAVAPTGTVIWTVTEGSTGYSCTNSGSTAVTAGSSNSSTATCDITTGATAGNYSVSVAYDGDPNYATANGSGSFTATSGASQLVFTSSPSSSVAAGTSFTLQVSEEDSSGDVVTSDSSSQVTLSIESGPTGGVLTCTNTGGSTVTLSSGVANFTCWLNIAGGYTIEATSSNSSVTAATTSVTIVAGNPTQLAFTGEPPASASAGTAFDVTVQVEDAYGNAVADSGVSVTLSTSPSTTITGTNPELTGSTGAASFSISIGAAGPYDILANATGTTLTEGTSTSITISAAGANQIVIVTSPGASTAGSDVTGPPTVEVEDGSGNGVSGVSVTVAIASGPTGGVFTSGSTLTETTGTNGEASFPAVVLDTAGTYTLTFSSSGLTSVTTASFTVAASVPATVTITTQPKTSTAGSDIAGPPTVTVKDAYGNLVSGASVTAAVAVGPGTFLNTSTVTVTTNSSGVAAFSALILGVVGSTYQLDFTSGSVTSADSSVFSVNAGTAASLVITSVPGTGPTSKTSDLTLTVTLEDAYGNPVATTAATTVNLGTTSSTGYFTSTLGGSTHITSVSIARGASSATFYYGDTTAGAPTLSVSISTGAYTTGTQGETIFGVFSVVAPTAATAGSSFSVTITAVNSSGATATGYSGTETLTFSGPSSSLSGSAPSYPATVTFTDGVGMATITLYDAQTTAITVTQDTATGTSNSIVVSSTGTFAGYSFVTVANQVAGTGFTVTINAADTYGNPVTTYSGTVTVSFTGAGTSPGGTGPSYPTTVTFASGVATTSITLYDAQTGISLTVSSTSPAATGTSNTFNVTAAPAATIAISTSPSTSTAGSDIAGPPAAKVEDQYGNPVSGVVVTAAVNTGPSASFASTSTLSETSGSTGVASFTALILDTAGSYTIDFFSGALTSPATSSFTVNPAAATVFVVSTPSTVTAGTAFTVTLTAEDAYGNQVTTYSSVETITFSGPSRSPDFNSPSYPSSVSFSGGMGSASVILYDAQSTTLKAAQGTTVTGTSPSFTVVAGAPATVHITTQPGTSTAGSAVAGPPTMTVTDTYGNDVGGVSVTASIDTGPSGATLAASSTNPVTTTSSGVATFSNLVLDTAGTTYRLTFTAGTASANSNTFTVNALTTVTAYVITNPGTQTAGTSFSVTITAVDQYSNTVTSYSASASITFSGPGPSPNYTSPVYPASVTFTTGVGHATITLYNAATGVTLTATNSSNSAITGTSTGFTVNPASASAFWVGPVAAQTAGASFGVPIEAVDAWGNQATGFTNSQVLSFSGADVSPDLSGPSYPSSVSFSSGLGTATVTLYDAESMIFTVAQGSINGSCVITVLPGPVAGLSITGEPGSFAAGSSTTVTVSAVDAWGNATDDDPGAVSLTVTEGPAATFTGFGPVALSGGSATFTISTTTAGSYEVTGSDSSYSTGPSSSFTVSPATATQLVASGEPPASSPAGTAFSIGITEEDAYGNTETTDTTTQVTLGFGSNPGSSTLDCTNTGGTTATVSGGVASFMCSLNVADSGYTLVASSGSLTPATTNPFTIAPSTAPSTTGVIDNSGTVSAGGSLMFTATVSGSSGTPTGTVTWSVAGPDGALSCSSSSLSGSGTASCTITGAVAGSYSATASYGGEPGVYSSSSGSDTTANVGQATPTVSVGDNSSGIAPTGTLVFMATVNGFGGIAPTGTVNWSVTGPKGALPCSSTTPLSAGTATCSISGADAGPYSATATYGGDVNYLGNSGSDTTADVAPGSITQTGTMSGTTTTASSKTFTSQLQTSGGNGSVSYAVITYTLNGGSISNPGIKVSSSGAISVTSSLAAGTYAVSGTDTDPYGDQGSWSFTLTVGSSTSTSLSISGAVTYGSENVANLFSVTVSPSGGGGTVAIMDGSTQLCSFSLGSTSCALSSSQLSPGTYPLTAVYTPSSSGYLGSTSPPVSLKVNPASTTVTFSITTPATYGAESSAQVTVSVSSSGGSPTGTVAIRIGSTTLCSFSYSGGSDSTTCLSNTAVNVGSFSVTAAFTPTSGDFASSSASAPLVVDAAATSTSLTISSPVTFGAENVTKLFQVTVSGTGVTPTGSVSIRNGSTTLCTVTLSSGSGSCTVTASQLAAGTYSTLTAVYAPSSSNYASSTSTDKTLVVDKAATTISGQSISHTTSGSRVTVTMSATLKSSATGSGISGQSLTFTLNYSGGSATCSATTNSSGVATCSVTVTATEWTAATTFGVSYAGNADYLAASPVSEPA